MKKTILIILLFCAIFQNSFSQENSEPKKEQTITSENTDNSNYLLLETKLDSCKDSFDRVNTTYQWSIGILLTAVLAFLGITGYNYHKNFKADLQKIKEELEQDYQNKVNELLQKNSKLITDKTELIEHRLKQELLQQRYDFLAYKFEHEQIDKIKLSLTLKILNTLSEANWGYSDWIFNDYFDYIKKCCTDGIYFDHSEVDDVKEMLAKLPERLKSEKEELQTIIKYEK